MRHAYGGSSRAGEQLPDKHREGKQTDGIENITRRRRGRGRVRQSAWLTLAAVMLIGTLAAKDGRSRSDTQCFQNSFQEDQGEMREDGECRAQVRCEFQRQDTSSTTWWFENRRRKAIQQCRIGEAEKPGPPDKIKQWALCGAQCQMQARKGKCAVCEASTKTVWKCSTCSDGMRKRGTLMCEECLKSEALVKGEEGTKAKESAGVSNPTQGEETTELDIAENDLKKCNVCSEPSAIRRARRQDHGRNCSTNECGCAFVSTKTSRSWIYTCKTCQRHLCTDCHAKEIGKAPTMRAYASAATPPSAALPVVEPEPEKDKSHERLLFLLSKIDALPQIQTIQWIPRGLDRRYAAVRLQALDRAIQAAKANTAASTQKLWSKVALLIPDGVMLLKELNDGARS